MKQILIKVAIVVSVFILTVLITSKVMNKDDLDLTTTMRMATYPVVTTEYNGIAINRMYGYTGDMELSYMRESITPLMEGRKIHIMVDTYGTAVSSMSFDVRTVDNNRLIESTDIKDYVVQGRNISADIVLKDLIDINSEYELILYLNLNNGKQVKYYTRVINTNNYFISDKLEFVYSFSNKIFDKDAALELKLFLESNSKGDNTTFGKVNINSSFNQVTWGDLNPLRITDPVITIKELAPMTGSFLVDYFISTEDDNGTKFYKVQEFYRVRYGKERMYLLDYERTMDEMFVDEKSSYRDDKIMLGIISGDTNVVESDDGNNIAFVSGGRLFEYTISDNRIAYIFGFYDIYTNDERVMNDDFDIKVMNIDEAGNVTFVVYGYMNRGTHEGECGVSAYYYNAQLNTLEEMIYRPSVLAPDLLIAKVNQLSYMNSEGVMYNLIGNTLYGIKADPVEVNVIADNLVEDTFIVSENNHLAAWLDGSSIYDCQKLILMDFETGVEKNITASSEDTIVPIGFIEEDVIYGVAHKSDITLDRMGNKIIPMYKVIIQSETEGVLMTYKHEGMYIIDGNVKENLITLKRMIKIADGVFSEADDDQIMNSDEEAKAKNSISTITTELYEKQTYIAIKKEINVNNMKHLTPQMIATESDIEIQIDEDTTTRQFVVYGKYGAESIHTDAAASVKEAYLSSGTVLEEEGRYIYQKTSRNTRNQIMAIKESASDENRKSLAVCLDTLLEYEGVVRNSQYMFSQGYGVIDVMEAALEGYEVLDLTGCTLDIVLYYVNKDIPVLVMTGDESAVLLIGFNDSEVVLMDPDRNEIFKMPTEEAEEWFESSGNGYITYLRKVEE